MESKSQTYSLPEPCGLPQEIIFDIGEQFGKHVGYHPGDDLSPIVESLGGTISYQSFFDLDLSTSGSIEIDGEQDFRIYLATHTSQARDRYTISHELGHYALHYLLANQDGKNIQRLHAARYGNGKVEVEANWFAASFLMPRDAFTQRYKKHKGNVSLIAEEFGVSGQACTVRATTLRLKQ